MTSPFSELEETIFKDATVLEEGYQPDKIFERESEIEAYRNALKAVLFGRNPPNVFVYGKSGVGKSAVTRYILSELQKATEDRPEADDVWVQFINCNNRTAYSLVSSLVNRIRPETTEKFPERGLSIEAAMNKLYEYMDERGGTFLFVLDEIDHLKNVNSLLYELPRARSNGYITNSRVGVIGISNNYTFRKSLSPKVKGTLMEKEISFAPYDAHELKSILFARADKAFQEGAYQDSAIALCSAIAAKDTGSARQAIDILYQAGELAENDGAGTISDEYVNDAQNVVRRGRITERIREQTTHSQLVLEAVARLELQDKTPAKSKHVKEEYSQTAYSYSTEPLSTLKSVQNHLSDLEMLGFLSRREHNDGMSGGAYFTYSLELDPQEVIKIRSTIEEDET